MRDISTTVNATEALQARIDLHNEDLLKYEMDLKKLKIKVKNAKFKETLYFFLAILTWIIDVPLVVLIIDNLQDSGVIPIFVILHALIGYLFFRKSKNYEIDDSLIKEINDIEEYIARLEEEVSTLSQEKRDFLLSSERQIKFMEEDSVIKEDFSLEAVNGDVKECPMCAEMVKSRAKICRYCGYNFLGTDSDPTQPKA